MNLKKLTIAVCVICAFGCIGIVCNFEPIPIEKMFIQIAVSFMIGAFMNFFLFVSHSELLRIEQNKTDHMTDQLKYSYKEIERLVKENQILVKENIKLQEKINKILG